MRSRTSLLIVASVAFAAAVSLVGSTLTAGSAGAATPARIDGTAFGIHYRGLGQTSGRYWPAVKYGLLRIWDNGTSWRELEPAQGQWDASALATLDYLVNNAALLHKKVLLVLGQTPQWASSCPDRTSDPSLPGDPRTTFAYGPGAGCEPTDMTTWANYVSFLLERYGAKIGAVQAWNEANYPTYWQSSGGMTSTTAESAMAQLALRAGQVIRAYNAAHGTHITVVAPSMGARHPNMPTWLHDFLVQANSIGARFDALAIHMYPNTGGTPESTLGPLAKARALRDHLAPGVPIWDTEVGFGLKRQNYLYGVGANAQGIVARAFLLELSSGLAKVFWYGWGDRGYSGLWLTNADGTTSNNGLALNRVYGWLNGSRPYGCGHGNTLATQYIWTCRLALANGSNARAMWAIKGAPVVTTPLGTQRIDYITGGYRAVGAGYRQTLSTAPVLIRGTFTV